MTPPAISVTPKHTVKDVVRFFWQHCRKHRFLGISVLFLTALEQVLQNVFAPLWYKRFVDAITGVTALAHPRTILLTILLTVIGIRLSASVIGYIERRCNIRFQLGVMHSLHEEVMRKTLLHSYRFFTDHFTGSLTRKLGRVAGLFEQLADMIMVDAWSILFSVGGVLVVLFRRYPLLACIALAWIGIVVTMKAIYIRSRLKYFAEASKLDAVTMGVMADAFGNAVTIKSFAHMEQEVDRFLEADSSAMVQTRRNWIAHANIHIVNVSMNILLEVCILAVLIDWLIMERITVGDVVLVQSFLLVIFSKVENIARLIRRIFEASSQVKEILDIIWAPLEITDASQAKALRVARGRIEFRHVRFSYHEQHIFDRLNLDIAPREKIAFVGPSGAGKSTLTKLLLRFYDLNHGSILIDGQDIALVTQDSLREAVAVVPQDPVLFHRTLKENIQYGRLNASDRQIVEAAKRAHCHEFITKLPQGYDTLVGERGVKLSGGERQRVAIARAILKNAPILVLDEATSSLDSESESLIQDALHTLMKNKTVIVIAHRLSTIMEMDRIIVMEQGKVVDEGTHDELLQKVGIHQKLWNIQAGSY